MPIIPKQFPENASIEERVGNIVDWRLRGLKEELKKINEKLDKLLERNS